MNNYKAVPSFISPSVRGDFLEVSANVHSHSLLNAHWFGLKVSHASFRSNFFSQHLLQHRRKPLVHSSDLKDHGPLKVPSQSERSSAACLTRPRTGQFNMCCLACKQNSFCFTVNPHGCPKGSPTARHLLMERDCKPLRLLAQVAVTQVTQRLPCDQKVACLLPSPPAVHTSGCCCITCERVLRMK